MKEAGRRKRHSFMMRRARIKGQHGCDVSRMSMKEVSKKYGVGRLRMKIAEI